MLDLRPNCECCDKDLPNGAPDALICTYECTFCADCARTRLGGLCPNCGGDLVKRPTRPARMLEKHPASTRRVRKDHPAFCIGIQHFHSGPVIHGNHIPGHVGIAVGTIIRGRH